MVLTFVTNAFSIQTIPASVVRSSYRNLVRLPFIIRIGAAGARCAGDFSQRFTMLLVLFSPFAYLKDEVFHSSSPSLFDKSISALSAALAAQTSVTANVSEYVPTKWHESDLPHALFTLPNNLNGNSW